MAGIRLFLKEDENVRKLYRADRKLPISLRAELKGCRDILFEEFDASAMRTFPDLMSAFEARFGFGPSRCHNWAAFHDCMRDIPLQKYGGGLTLINSSENLLRKEPSKIATAIDVFGDISEEWGTPVENGDWWDRPAFPFAVIFQGAGCARLQGLKHLEFEAESGR